jgi:Rrf2 family protein
MPQRFVHLLLRQLTMKRIVASSRGRSGGYKLAKPASKITLIEIIEAIEGPLKYGLDGDLPLTPEAIDASHRAFAAIEAEARKRLAAITVADLRAAKG